MFIPLYGISIMKKHSLSYRLGLDLGTNSIGWAMIRLNSQKDPIAVIKAGVRIFSDGREAGNPDQIKPSRAVQRRLARSARRRRDRLLQRKSKMMGLLIEFGFFPTDLIKRKNLEKLNPYNLRAKGVEEKLKPEEFARALFHINQRRGFKSNRKTDKDQKESGALKAAISGLRNDLKKGGHKTVGQFLYQRMIKGELVKSRFRQEKKVVNGENKTFKSYDLFIDRKMVEDEFDVIWKKQSEFNESLFNDKSKKELKDCLLFQRPLKIQKPGKCTFIPTEERAPKALPSVQKFRILQEVNNLKIIEKNLEEKNLEIDQRNFIVEELSNQKSKSFSSIRNKLKLDPESKFNLEGPKRNNLKGNETNVELSKKEAFGKLWMNFDLQKQDEIVERLLKEQDEQELINWLLKNTNINTNQAEYITDLTLTDGYGNLSEKAIALINPELEKTVITYDKAALAAGFKHSEFAFDADENEFEHIEKIIQSTGEIKKLKRFKNLPYYGKPLNKSVAFGSNKPLDSDEKRYGKIANPTVHIGLNQIRVVVNELIKSYGHPEQVIIEVARDLKKNKKQKEASVKQQAKNQKRNERIRKEISQFNNQPENSVVKADIQKFILWEELNKNSLHRCCPYSGQQISVSDLLSGQVEVEHILPFSRTLDDSLNNKTISTREANQIKGNRTPYEAKEDFESKGKRWSYDKILDRAKEMDKNEGVKKASRFAKDGLKKWLKEDSGFLPRALNDTRYLSTIARDYMQLICPQDTRVIPGQLTAMLRGKFGLNEILSEEAEKNRFDHRHHAVDACVIAVTDHGLLQNFANASSQAKQKGLQRLVEQMPLPWNDYYNHVKRTINRVKVSHRPDHGHQGRFLKETAKKVSGDKKAIAISDQAQVVRNGKIELRNEFPYKEYETGSNYAYEIFKEENGEWNSEIISRFRANQIYLRTKTNKELRNPRKAQNGKPLVIRIMIDDCVKIDSQESILRCYKMTTLKGINYVYLSGVGEANVNARLTDRYRKKDGKPDHKLSQVSWLREVLKNAEQLRLENLKMVTISPTGKVNIKKL